MYDVNLMPDIPKLCNISPGDFNVVREMNEKKEGKRKKKYLLILPCSKRKKRISNAYAILKINHYDHVFIRKNPMKDVLYT